MKTISKYQLPTEEEFELELPMVWKPVSIQMQEHSPILWAYRGPFCH